MAIQIRRGTELEWESANQNILPGEPAIALDSERVRVGTANGKCVELAKATTLDAIAEISGIQVITNYKKGYYMGYYQSGSSLYGEEVEAPNFMYAEFQCSPGDKFTIGFNGTQSVPSVLFEGGGIIPPSQYRPVQYGDFAVYTAPENAGTIYVNNWCYNGASDDYRPNFIGSFENTLKGDIDELKEIVGDGTEPWDYDPEMDGTASPGDVDEYARGNHVHPTDTTRASASDVGNKADLDTETQTDLVSAINEVVSDVTNVKSDLSQIMVYFDAEGYLCFQSLAE